MGCGIWNVTWPGSLIGPPAKGGAGCTVLMDELCCVQLEYARTGETHASLDERVVKERPCVRVAVVGSDTVELPPKPVERREAQPTQTGKEKPRQHGAVENAERWKVVGDDSFSKTGAGFNGPRNGLTFEQCAGDPGALQIPAGPNAYVGAVTKDAGQPAWTVDPAAAVDVLSLQIVAHSHQNIRAELGV